MGDILNCHIRFEGFRKKTDYTYTIKGSMAYRGGDRDFVIEYSGADLNVISGFISPEIVDALKKYLNEQDIYGPFTKEKAAKLKNIISIVFSVHGKEVINTKPNLKS